MSSDPIDWTKRYGDIVWAKAAGNFPFWPARIFDPDSSHMPDYLKVSKSCPYAVVFYGDGTYSSASSKTLKEFLGVGNDTALRSKQKIHARYAKLFPVALQLADADFARPEGMRQPMPEFIKEDNGASLEETKNKDKNRKKGAQSGDDSNDDQLGIYDFGDMEQDPALGKILAKESKGGKSAAHDDDDEEEEGGDEEEKEEEEVEDEEEFDEREARKGEKSSAAKRKRSDSSADRERRPSTSSQPASSHKKKKLVKRSDMASASTESTKKSEKPTGSATKVAGLDFKQETREDRLARLVKNLTKLTNEATLDEQSALRTLNKIADMNLKTSEFEIGDVVKFVASLRKSSSKEIRDKARTMRQCWIQMVAAAAAAAATDPMSVPTPSAPTPPTPAPLPDMDMTLPEESSKTPGDTTTSTSTTTETTTITITVAITAPVASKVEFKTPAPPYSSATSSIQSPLNNTSTMATISGGSVPSIPGTVTATKQTVTAVRAEDFPRISKSSLSPEVLESAVRTSAVRLMFEVLLNIDAAAKVEETALLVAEGKMDRYFECISRFFLLLKRQEKSSIKKSLLTLSTEDEREWPERKLEIEHILRSTFDYVSAT